MPRAPHEAGLDPRGPARLEVVALVVLLLHRRWSLALLLFLTGILASLAMNIAGALIIDPDLATLLARLGADGTRTST